MTDMNQLWSWALAAVGITGIYLAGRKNKLGWAIGLGAQVLWLAYAFATRQWGFIATAIAYGFVYGRNWWRWHTAESTTTQAVSVDETGQEVSRAEVAEGIAQAIEVAGGIRCPTCHELPDSIGSHTYWCANNHMWHGEPFNAAEGAEIARGYTQPAETPGHRDGTPAAPVQPTQERPLS